MKKAAASVWVTGLKVSISLAALAYVGWKLYEDRGALGEIWDNLDAQAILLMAIALLLLIPNLGLEVYKWILMVKPHYPDVSFKLGLKAVLAGMAAGIFTPNRIGEYAGRVFYLQQGNRVKALVATFIDRICQMGITLLLGMLALSSIFWGKDQPEFFGENLDLSLFYLSAVSLLIVLFFLFFPASFAQSIPAFLLKYNWVRQVKEAGETVSRKQVLKVFSLAFARYFTFSTQYVLLLYAVDFPGTIPAAYFFCSLVFLGKSVIPVPGILELGLRETIAIQIFALAGLSAAGAVQSTFILYLINIILPTLVGVFALQGIRPWTKKEARS